MSDKTIIRFDELTRTRLRELAPHATVVVPLGSTEQHGPHLPVSTDLMIVTEVATRAVAAASQEIPVLLLPTQPFGFAHHHLPFGGTISVDQETYSRVLTGIGQSLARDGFSRIVFLNGHGGNVSSMQQAVDRLAYECDLEVHVGGTSYWSCAGEQLKAFDLDLGPVPGHAGNFETSCMLALRPDLVRSDAIPAPEKSVQPLAEIDLPGGSVRNPGVWQDSDGRTDDSAKANAELGHRALDLIAAEVAAFLIDFHMRTV